MPLRQIAIPLLAAWLAACAGFAPGTAIEPPQVRLADIRIAELGLFEQRYVLDLRVSNPNGFPVPVTGLVYRLAINGEPFGSGTSDRPLSLQANGETRVAVELVSSTEETLQQLRRLAESSSDTLSYALYGEVRLQGRTEPLPFGAEGTLGEASRGTAI